MANTVCPAGRTAFCFSAFTYPVVLTSRGGRRGCKLSNREYNLKVALSVASESEVKSTAAVCTDASLDAKAAKYSQRIVQK